MHEDRQYSKLRRRLALLVSIVALAVAVMAPAGARADVPFNGLTFHALSTNPTAGGFSPFTFNITRPAGDQEIKQVTLDTPVGFAAILRGVTQCSEAQIATAASQSGLDEQTTPGCPSNSLIGRTDVQVGAGDDPLMVSGKVYLAGPYNGAPLSTAIVVPNLAGPFDLGTTVVRAAIYVDQSNAKLHIVSDEIPRVVSGIVLDARMISVSLDRENFSINPTNCAPSNISATIAGYDGGVDNLSVPYQVGGCGALPFNPSITAHVIGGPGATTRSQNLGLRVDLNPRPGDANQHSVSFALADSIQIDQSHLSNICSESELANIKCAGRQVIGSASATTPVLDQPLSGPVYAVSGSGGLPRLAVILNGTVDLVLRGNTTTQRNPDGGAQIVNTFAGVPDAPVDHFELTIDGGSRGYLVTNRDLCEATKKVKVKKKKGKKGKAKTRTLIVPAKPSVNTAVITSQNGITRTIAVPLNPDCTGRQNFTKVSGKKKKRK